jgi:hypothetical protein
MKTTLSIIGSVVLGFFLLTAAGISPAMGESNKSFGAEDFVVPSIETPSFGAEDFVVASLVTPSFGTEDWVGPSETPSFGTEDWVLASEAITFGAEDWIEGMEYSDTVATGTLPEPAR